MSLIDNTTGYIREHPYQTGAIAVVGLVAIYLIVHQSGAAAASRTGQSTIDPAIAGLESQQMQTQAALQAAQIQANAQVAGLAQQGANQIAIAQIQAHSQGELATIQAQTQDTIAQLSADLGIKQIQGQLDQATLQAGVANNTINTQGMVQLAQTEATVRANELAAQTSIQNTAANDAAQVNIAGINGQTQQYVAQVVGTTQQQIATNQANVAIEQTRANVEIAKTITAGQTTSGIAGIVGGIIGALL